MATKKKESQAAQMASLRALIAGVKKHMADGPPKMANRSLTTAALVQTLQNLIDALAARAKAQARLADAVLALRAADEVAAPVIAALRDCVHARYGAAADKLADFGMTPLKARKPMTGAAKVEMGKRNRSTRAARRTLGPKKKLAIKGVVPPPETAASPPEGAPKQAPAPRSKR